MDPRGLGVTLNAYFSFSKHTKQLSLVTYCHTPAGIEVCFRTHGRRMADGRTHGRKDRRGSQNSYLDAKSGKLAYLMNVCFKG